MMHLAAFWNLFCIYLRQSFYHRKAALMTVLTWSFRTGITILLYTAIYRILGQTQIRHITYEVAISGMLLSAVFFGFATREVSFQINGENKSGLLEMWINKPLSYVGIKIVEVLGRGVPAVLALMCTVALFWLVSDRFPRVDHVAGRLIAGLVLLAMGLAISVSLFAMSGLTSVFIQDALPANQLMDRIISIFSGMFIPLGFYPHWFRLTGEMLPMGATTYVTQIFYPDFFHNLPRFLLTQCVWLILCILGLRRFNRAAKARLTINGG